jgi:hypothetical protein
MSSHLNLTAHAAARISQRGIARNSLELIMSIGTEVEGGYLVRDKDFEVFDRELKRLRQWARRLVGKRMVIKDDQLVITAYQLAGGKERRLLRSAREVR